MLCSLVSMLGDIALGSELISFDLLSCKCFILPFRSLSIIGIASEVIWLARSTPAPHYATRGSQPPTCFLEMKGASFYLSSLSIIGIASGAIWLARSTPAPHQATRGSQPPACFLEMNDFDLSYIDFCWRSFIFSFFLKEKTSNCYYLLGVFINFQREKR